MSGTKYIYWDAFRNVYTVQVSSETGEATFQYDPMTPERSSTGTYSGGRPVSRTLPKSVADEFVQRFEQWRAAEGDKPFTMQMGECRFSAEGADGRELANFGVHCGNSNLRAWEQALATLMQEETTTREQQETASSCLLA